MSTGVYLVLLALTAVQRLAELRISRRHARLALARGGIEAGRGHFAAMKVLHGAFLAACAAEVLLLDRRAPVGLSLAMLVLTVLAQGLRWWSMRALGPAWNARVVVVPGEPRVTRGPYRWLRHPNYLAVVVEGVSIPMMRGAWLTAVAFSVANAVLLRVRVRCEEELLRAHAGPDR